MVTVMSIYNYEDFNYYMVADEAIVYEIHLQHAWNNIPINKAYHSTEDDEVLILAPGTWNREEGPDFLNAKISINSHIYIGDVEVHVKTSDWYNHGHDKDRNYDNVILHVIADNNRDRDNSPPMTALIINVPKVNDFNLNREKYQCGKCSHYYSQMQPAQLKVLFMEAGLERFSSKSSYILEQMLKYGADDALWEAIFEATGYKNNKHNFKELYKRYRQYPDEAKKNCTDSILWGESGLLPDLVSTELDNEMEPYTQKCWEQWWTVRPEAHEEISWKRSGSRPLNSPERRIAALAILMQKVESPTKIFSLAVSDTPADQMWLVLKKILITKSPLWDSYTNFTNKRGNAASVLGEYRALDLSINVILPAIHAYARLTQNDQLFQQSRDCWLALPKAQNNYIFSIVRKKWFLTEDIANEMISNAAIQQGILHVYRNFCASNQMDCNSCLLVNSIY